MGIIVYDTLKEPVNTTILLKDHVSPIGDTWTNHPNALYYGQLRFFTNRVYADGGPAMAYTSGVPNTTDYDIYAKYYIQSQAGAGGGIIGRMDPTQNTCYMFYYSGGYWTFSRYVNDSFTTIAQAAATVSDTTMYDIIFQCRTPTKNVFVNGSLVISVSDNVISNTGRVGIRGNNAQSSTAGTHIYEIVVEDFYDFHAVSDSDTVVGTESTMSRTATMGLSDTDTVSGVESNMLTLTSRTLTKNYALWDFSNLSIATTLPRSDSVILGTSSETLSILTAINVNLSDSGSVSAAEDRTMAYNLFREDSWFVASEDASVVHGFPSIADTGTLSVSESRAIDISMEIADAHTLMVFEDVDDFHMVAVADPFEDTRTIGSIEIANISTSGDGVLGDSHTIGVTEGFDIAFTSDSTDEGTIVSEEAFEVFFGIDVNDDVMLELDEGYDSVPYSDFSEDFFFAFDQVSNVQGTMSLVDTANVGIDETLFFSIVVTYSDSDTITAVQTMSVIKTHDFSDNVALGVNEVQDIVTEYPPVLNELNQDDIDARSTFLDVISHHAVIDRPITIRYQHQQISDESQPSVTNFVVLNADELPVAVGTATTNWLSGLTTADIYTNVYDYPSILLLFFINAPPQG